MDPLGIGSGFSASGPQSAAATGIAFAVAAAFFALMWFLDHHGRRK